MLFIPESRKRPIIESLLYKQIVKFLEEEKIRDKFEIAFISINDGIVDARNYAEINAELRGKLPPKNFRSGKVLVSKEQIEKMVNSIVDYLSLRGAERRSNPVVIAYCRGVYLQAVRLANQKSGIKITEIFNDDELTQLKKKGIMWMKVGLRMPTPFIVFRLKIKELVKGDKDRQLRLF